MAKVNKPNAPDPEAQFHRWLSDNGVKLTPDQRDLANAYFYMAQQAAGKTFALSLLAQWDRMGTRVTSGVALPREKPDGSYLLR